MAKESELHCARCSWEGEPLDCEVEACPVCGSEVKLYAEWLTDHAEDR